VRSGSTDGALPWLPTFNGAHHVLQAADVEHTGVARVAVSRPRAIRRQVQRLDVVQRHVLNHRQVVLALCGCRTGRSSSKCQCGSLLTTTGARAAPALTLLCATSLVVLGTAIATATAVFALGGARSLDVIHRPVFHCRGSLAAFVVAAAAKERQRHVDGHVHLALVLLALASCAEHAHARAVVLSQRDDDGPQHRLRCVSVLRHLGLRHRSLLLLHHAPLA
jgi:hypothetical protein